MTTRLLRKLRDSLREDGLKATTRSVWLYIVKYLILGRRRLKHHSRLEREDGFDAKYGTDTSSIVYVDDLDMTEEERKHAVLYWPSLQRTLDQVLSRVEVDFREFTFVDLGSGKGRAVLMASFRPFRRIIGVELSSKLHDIACRNVEMFRPTNQRCHAIELVSGDAVHFAFPRDNLVLYLFDPFDATVLAPVMNSLKTSLAEQPRAVWLIYLHARYREVIENTNMFELVCELPRVGHSYTAVQFDCRVYRNSKMEQVCSHMP